MSATVERATADEVRRVDDLLADVAGDRLGVACRAMSAPPGLWCLRRLDLRLALDLSRPDGELGTRWTEGLVAALHAALRSGSTDLVHYRSRYDAVDELVRATAAGRTEHVWAWRQLALVEATDPSPEQDPGALIVAALSRVPERTLAAVLAAVRVVGLTRLHRALGAEGWREVARIACRAEGADPGLVTAAASPAPHRPARAAAGADNEGRRVADLGMLLADSTLATAIATEGWTVDEPTYRSWAVLVIAQASPGRLRRRGAAVLVDEVARAVAVDHGGGPRPGLGRGRPAPDPDISTRPPRPGPATTRPRTSASGAAEPPGTRHGDVPRRSGAESGAASGAASALGPRSGAVPRPGQPPYAAPTRWGGLLFLVAAAPEAGVPDEIVRVPRLAGRSTRWVLHQLAIRLVPAAPDDPAVLAMSGLPPGSPEPSGRPPGRRERRVLDRSARRWCVATARRLGWDHLEPADAVVRLAARRAEVVADPGWIEVHLRLDDVDVDARRAGLDLDPGWVSWLGVVVRFVYA